MIHHKYIMSGGGKGGYPIQINNGMMKGLFIPMGLVLTHLDKKENKINYNNDFLTVNDDIYDKCMDLVTSHKKINTRKTRKNKVNPKN